MAKRRDGKRGAAGEDDAALFRHVVGDAVPLKRRRKSAPADPPPQSTRQSNPQASSRHTAQRGKSVKVPAAAPLPAPVVPASPQPADITPRGSLAGIDRRTADRLRRGRLAIEARLDLHGRYQDDAHRALNEFVVASAGAGRRVLLVITGKGRVSEGGGVLRRNVPHWLRLAPCAPHVLAVVPAQPQHGGSGALYVMLRRKRD